MCVKNEIEVLLDYPILVVLTLTLSQLQRVKLVYQHYGIFSADRIHFRFHKFHFRFQTKDLSNGPLTHSYGDLCKKANIEKN